MGEYATLAHPSIPSTIPAANTAKVMAFLEFSVISSLSQVLYSTLSEVCSNRMTQKKSFCRFFLHIKQLIGSTIKAPGTFQGPWDADVFTFETENALCGKDPLSALNIVDNADIHRAYLFTSPTVVTLFGITGYLQERETAGHLEKSRYR